MDLLLQIILARRNNDTEGWMNILFVVVLAIFWLIGGILKAKANKSGVGNKGKIPPMPSRKPPIHSREAREQMLRRLERPADSAKTQIQQPRPATQKPRMKFADLQAAVRKFAVEAEKAFQDDTKKPIPKPKPPLQEPQLLTEKPKIEEPFSVTSSLKELPDKQVSEPDESPGSEFLSELLMDYTDPDELRRAILHYEILGKPLSLRDPSENNIEL